MHPSKHFSLFLFALLFLFVTLGVTVTSAFLANEAPYGHIFSRRNPLHYQVARCGGKFVFTACIDPAGCELWVADTDNITRSARLLKDIEPGRKDSNPRDFHATADGRYCLFNAQTQQSGIEPWVTDGTESGTMSLGDLRTGSSSSNTRFFQANSTTYFLALTSVGNRWYYFSPPSTANIITLMATATLPVYYTPCGESIFMDFTTDALTRKFSFVNKTDIYFVASSLGAPPLAAGFGSQPRCVNGTFTIFPTVDNPSIVFKENSYGMLTHYNIRTRELTRLTAVGDDAKVYATKPHSKTSNKIYFTSYGNLFRLENDLTVASANISAIGANNETALANVNSEYIYFNIASNLVALNTNTSVHTILVPNVTLIQHIDVSGLTNGLLDNVWIVKSELSATSYTAHFISGNVVTASVTKTTCKTTIPTFAAALSPSGNYLIVPLFDSANGAHFVRYNFNTHALTTMDLIPGPDMIIKSSFGVSGTNLPLVIESSEVGQELFVLSGVDSLSLVKDFTPGCAGSAFPSSVYVGDNSIHFIVQTNNGSDSKAIYALDYTTPNAQPSLVSVPNFDSTPAGQCGGYYYLNLVDTTKLVVINTTTLAVTVLTVPDLRSAVVCLPDGKGGFIAENKFFTITGNTLQEYATQSSCAVPARVANTIASRFTFNGAPPFVDFQGNPVFEYYYENVTNVYAFRIFLNTLTMSCYAPRVNLTSAQWSKLNNESDVLIDITNIRIWDGSSLSLFLSSFDLRMPTAFQPAANKPSVGFYLIGRPVCCVYDYYVTDFEGNFQNTTGDFLTTMLAGNNYEYLLFNSPTSRYYFTRPRANGTFPYFDYHTVGKSYAAMSLFNWPAYGFYASVDTTASAVTATFPPCLADNECTSPHFTICGGTCDTANKTCQYTAVCPLTHTCAGDQCIPPPLPPAEEEPMAETPSTPSSTTSPDGTPIVPGAPNSSPSSPTASGEPTVASSANSLSICLHLAGLLLFLLLL